MTTGNRTSGDDAALVIERGDAGKVGDLSEDGVESVGLLTSLGRELSGSGPGLSTSGASGGVCSTLVHELVADELADNVKVLCRTVVVAHCVPKLITSVGSAWEEWHRWMGGGAGLTQIDRSERSFTTIIETNSELDFRNAARSKVANISGIRISGVVRGGARTVIASVASTVTSVPAAVAGVGTVIVSSVIEGSGNEVTLVIENGIIGKGGGDTKDGIESVRLNAGLGRGSGGSGGQGLGASTASGSVSLTSVHELVAHGLGDNADVLSRTVGVGF